MRFIEKTDCKLFVTNGSVNNTLSMGVRRGEKRAFSPLEIGTKKQKFLKNVKSAF